MTVWGVHRNYFTSEGYSFVGVFSSEKKARDFIEAFKGDICPCYSDEPGKYEIHKYEVDKPE